MKTQQKSGSLAKASRANRTKLVAVWHVEFSTEGWPQALACLSHERARYFARMLKRKYRAECIAISGPYQQRITA